MKCSICGCTEFRTKETKRSRNSFRRRRQCINCGTTFTTYEMALTPKQYKSLIKVMEFSELAKEVADDNGIYNQQCIQ